MKKDPRTRFVNRQSAQSARAKDSAEGLGFRPVDDTEHSRQDLSLHFYPVIRHKNYSFYGFCVFGLLRLARLVR